MVFNDKYSENQVLNQENSFIGSCKESCYGVSMKI